MPSEPHPVGDLSDTVAAIRTGKVDRPKSRITLRDVVSAVEIADERVTQLTGRRVAIRLPQVRLLCENPENHLSRNVATASEARQREHPLRGESRTTEVGQVRRAGGREMAQDRHINRPLDLTRLRLQNLIRWVVPRNRASAFALNGICRGTHRAHQRSRSQGPRRRGVRDRTTLDLRPARGMFGDRLLAGKREGEALASRRSKRIDLGRRFAGAIDSSRRIQRL